VALLLKFVQCHTVKAPLRNTLLIVAKATETSSWISRYGKANTVSLHLLICYISVNISQWTDMEQIQVYQVNVAHRKVLKKQMAKCRVLNQVELYSNCCAVKSYPWRSYDLNHKCIIGQTIRYQKSDTVVSNLLKRNILFQTDNRLSKNT
jgi:hypothetical protein